jgi:DNA polymerase-3 subunit gamma/tau
MSYVVLARKWRPMSFDDLVGQDHVSRTLGNAIKAGRVAHAFLFTGVRGVGKTTSARILAKALNCTGTAAEPRQGPTVTPCLECAACKEITAGTDVDVREIDGASYNGVDEVRKLQDSLPYRPARDRFKIFIVDEVHMLSQSAWNAFLKTLEEPPPHVKFIFATTEVHKVPVTILSRVQRFDFKLIPTKLIVGRLRHVLETEGIATDERALAIIAREAAGSMRDAMSLLDQVIAWNDRGLDGDSVARVLGVASRQVLHDLASALVLGDAGKCVKIVGDLANQGYDISVVARDVLSLLRDLVVAKVCAGSSDLLDLADEEQRDVVALSERTDSDDLLRLHQGFSAGFDNVVRSGQSRAALEMLLVRLARRPPLVPVEDLIVRLAQLEKRLGGTPESGPGGPPTGRTDGNPARSEARPAPHPPERPASHEVRSTVAAPSAPPARTDDPPAAADIDAAAARDLPPTPRVPPERATREDRAAATLESNGAEPMVVWRAIVDRVRTVRPEIAAFLNHAVVVHVTRERLVIAFEAGSVFERNARAPDSVSLLGKAAADYFGAEPAISFETITPSSAANGSTTVAAQDSQERALRKEAALARAKGHPRVAQASEILGARLKEIRLPDD